MTPYHLLLVLVLLLPGLAYPQGTPVFVTGLETADNAGTGSFELSEQGTTANVTLVTGGRCYDAGNGGSSTSHWCLKLTPAAGQNTWARLQTSHATNLDLDTNVGVASFCYHADAVPSSGSVTLAEFDMNGTRGGYLLLNGDTGGDGAARTLTLKYSATTFGTTAPFLERSCVDAIYQTCDENTDCPSATCDTCADGDPDGCAWTCVEMIQQNTTSTAGDQVQLDLFVNGEHVIVGSPQAASGLANITDWVPGNKTTVAGTGGATVYLDAIRVGTADNASSPALARLGWGPIHAIHPTEQQADVNMTTPGNCATAEAWSCLDDWSAGGSYNTADGNQNDTARARNIPNDGGTFTFGTVTAGTVSGVTTVIVGRTSDDTFTYTTSLAGARCDGTDCTYGTAVVSATGNGSTAHRLRQVMTSAAPPGGGAWSLEAIDEFASRFLYVSESSGGPVIRMGGLLAYVAENNADNTAPTTLPDRNGDGEVWVCAACDSLCSGTYSQVCVTDPNQACTFSDYCEWDALTGRDKPSGGCHGEDAACRTCDGLREQVNGGAGYRCDGVTSTCGDGTCDTGEGVCNNVPTAPCDADEDCEGFGSCPSEAAAECVASCPGAETACTDDDDCDTGEVCQLLHGALKCIGECPESGLSSWGAQVIGQLGPDVFGAQFDQGSESTDQLAVNRWAGIKIGRDHTGDAIRGTGQCACAVNGDCPGSGTCTSGRCVGGTACTTATGCTYPGGGPICDFPDCDVVVLWEGINEASIYPAPECRGWQANGNLICRGYQTAITVCAANQDCTATHGEDALCYGSSSVNEFIGGPGAGGSSLGIGRSTNTTATGGLTVGYCNSADDCVSGICWDADADPLGVYHLGFCGCVDDDDCADSVNYKCMDADTGTGGTQGMCRKRCTTSAECPDTNTCTSSACFGQCNTPCSAETCSVDADCPSVLTSNRGAVDAFGHAAASRATCVEGKCSQCGSSVCDQHGTAYTNAVHQLSLAQVRAYRYIVDDVGDDPTEPIPVFATPPLIGLSMGRCGDTGWSNVERNGVMVSFAGSAWNFGDYLMAVRHGLLNDPAFAHVCDLQPRYDRDRSRTTSWHILDGTHLAFAGAYWVGQEFGQCLDTVGTCVVDGLMGKEAQRYCREPDDDWRSPSDICDSAVDCANAGDRCQVRACDDDGDCDGSGSDYCNEA